MSDGKSDDISSVCSSFSEVSFRGEEISAEQAVDESIRDIQNGLNQANVLMRNLLTCDERGESWEVMFPMYTDIDELIKEAIVLFRELRGLAKQITPPKPRASKTAKKEPSMLESCGGGTV